AAAGFSWRADPMLLFLDTVTILLVLALAATPVIRQTGGLAGAECLDLLFGGVRAVGEMIAGPMLAWPALRSPAEAGVDRSSRRMLAATGRGLLLAVPLVVIFGALLISADAKFEALLSPLLVFDLDTVAPNLLRTGFFGWLGAGALVLTLAPIPATTRTPVIGVRLGATEVTTVLVVLDVLFLTFVVLQVGHLFGGDGLIKTTAGLTYADYARRGFFQLVVVCALALPVLLVLAHAVAEDPLARSRYRPLARFQVMLLLLILASAVHRLWLYVGAFGLSLSRLHAAAILLWIGTSLAWFGITVLRDRSGRFLRGALASGAVILGTMHLVNPAAIVARSLTGRNTILTESDARYLAGLGDDAVPALAAALPGLEEGNRARLTVAMQCRQHPVISDWTEWSVAKAEAVLAWPAEWNGGCEKQRDSH
ncbi:MAG: DUF4173 domain-containing protein, partial [Gemmatimonadota bacterium]